MYLVRNMPLATTNWTQGPAANQSATNRLSTNRPDNIRPGIATRSDVQTWNSFLAAASVLHNSNATNNDRVAALSRLGIDLGSQGGLLTAAQSNRLGAVLQLLTNVDRWNELNTTQQAGTILQGYEFLSSSLGQLGTSNSSSITAGNAAGATAGSTVGAALSVVGAITGVVLGIDQAADIIDAIEDMPRSQAVKQGAIGLSTTGAAIGAGVAGAVAAGSFIATGAAAGSYFPIIGTAIGAVIGGIVGVSVGSFGSGKSTSQKMRDAWRDSMEKIGIAQKIDGSHHLRLADGSDYNVGQDGSHRLRNYDGTERFTFDVDWSNPIAVNTIPEAHIFAIASGVDPSHADFGFFHAVTAQALNAATSNADTEAVVRSNFRTTLEEAGLGPLQIGLRLEVLRQTFKISESDYRVYVHHLNSVFGSKLTPSSREKSYSSLVQQLSAQPELSGAERELLLMLQNPEKMRRAEKQLIERIDASGVEN